MKKKGREEEEKRRDEKKKKAKASLGGEGCYIDPRAFACPVGAVTSALLIHSSQLNNSVGT